MVLRTAIGGRGSGSPMRRSRKVAAGRFAASFGLCGRSASEWRIGPCWRLPYCPSRRSSQSPRQSGRTSLPIMLRPERWGKPGQPGKRFHRPGAVGGLAGLHRVGHLGHVAGGTGLWWGDAACGTAETSVNGNRVDCNYGTIDEWYINGPGGLEQGFNVRRSHSPAPPGR